MLVFVYDPLEPHRTTRSQGAAVNHRGVERSVAAKPGHSRPDDLLRSLPTGTSPLGRPDRRRGKPFSAFAIRRGAITRSYPEVTPTSEAQRLR